ncbi:riboflavin biosynthesis protein RibD [Actinoplanes ianthinogenes]|uniref:Riboflavin biosynthesis protein RibD n=1 Tax=Actinoplanes ianthinogenes TaxID=122358 RepID=A0ABM7LPS4_9ACTN|nr:dihydrofolate reductase family protein [Actinoplanes ianthinogenes]BCJ41203.1 riboflavin biosynthesis protein RibD [Actinoplanes ianthinogenes]GGR22225.1 riboflavin biosynthesis protein RibD [Actinoplanes ianthinogenes]
MNSRRVVANISLSLDGRVNGPGGDYDMGWIVPHAVTDAAREHMVAVTGRATTAVLGRKNYQGFGGFWPAVAADENADPRDRAFSAWLNEVEKVVFSTTLTETTPAWAGTRVVAADPAAEIRRLRAREGGDIVVLASASIIRALLAADEVDRLSITLCPAVAGGGARLFEDGLPAGDWILADLSSTDSGAVCLLYDRAR